eukprot:Gregarina_sp_Poly_1__7697@NODE_433_length_8455_cov_489_751192_g353_i0_p1_GENE_NODE_433_length_8455_cov_489_751192_g353_i0NODE_433_length_8455_cov_489_751192_g353_i0_p1_ORF_typecomplete_len1400_score258_29zfC4H2/PF10146_9/0_00064AAA_13/PF13166_6/41AAA_13/PF13166_6/18AAA_13/PF13166_6/0_33AAA_13/PF13166_6/0_31Baculo_PEP_C/PF04513_12/81Baculo_PEP_C/PF04513_12/1_4e02Baculo_PEP_C/PF04513_12/5_9Baculo_PEP_C/PF04513_12/59Baculo_PEP_C/PF04513_12/2_4e02Baculo_PEP_C/PF04513_12/5_5ApoLpIII/PF07464_11/6_9e03
MTKLTLSMQEQIEMASNFADLIESAWFHMRVLSQEALVKPFLSAQKRVKLYVALAQSSNDWVPAAKNWLLRLPCPSTRTSRCKYRMLRAWKLFVAEERMPNTLITMTCRLIDSLFWICMSKLFASLYPVGPAPVHPASDTSLRVLPMGLEHLSAVFNLIAAWQAFGSAKDPPSLTSPETRHFSLHNLPRHPLYSFMANETREMITVLDHLIFPRITRRFQLKPAWVGFISAATCLYVHFAILLIVRSEDLKKTAETLNAFLPLVATRLQEGALPISSTEPKAPSTAASVSSLSLVPTCVPEETGSSSSGSVMRQRRFSWTKPQAPVVRRLNVEPTLSSGGSSAAHPGSSSSGARVRSLSDSSNAVQSSSSRLPPSDEALVSFNRKDVPQEWRPSTNSLSTAEVQTLPLGLSLLLPHHLVAMTDVIEALPNPDSLHLWVLLCIAEAQPQAAYIVSNCLLRDSQNEKDSIETTVEWLYQAAAEGAQIFEARLGRNVFNWESTAAFQKSEQSPERKTAGGGQYQKLDKVMKMAQSVWKVLSLRFLDLGALGENECQTEKFQEIIKGRIRNDESKYVSAFIRVIGDGVVQAAVDDGIPLVLLSAKPRRRDSEAELLQSRSKDEHALVTLDELKRVRSQAVQMAESKRRDGEQMCIDEQSRTHKESLTRLNCLTKAHTESLSTLQNKAACVEHQLTNLIEGSVARHSNQIKSFMDRFDSFGQELRRLSGISATQNSATSTQIVELKRLITGVENTTKQLQSQLENLHSTKSSLFTEGLLLDHGELKALTKSLEERVNAMKLTSEQADRQIMENLKQLETEIADRRPGLESQAQEFFSELKSEVGRAKEDMQQQQRQALGEALENLQGLSQSVKDILDKQQQNELGLSGEDIAKLMQATDRRFSDIVATLDERFACWAASQDTDSLKSLLSRIESRIAAVEAKTRITESALNGGDKLTNAVSKRMRELESSLSRLEADFAAKEQDSTARALDTSRSVEDLGHHIETRMQSLSTKAECSELMSSLKKKVKHEYVGQLVARMDSMEAQLLTLRASDTDGTGFEPRRTRTPQGGTENQPAENRGLRWEAAVDSIRKNHEQLQWDLQEIRQTLDTMLSASMTEIQSLRSDVERMKRDRKNYQEDLNAKNRKIELMESTMQNFAEEREKAYNIFAELREKNVWLQERLGYLESQQQLKSRRLHFWSKQRSTEEGSRRGEMIPMSFGNGYPTLAASPSDLSSTTRHRSSRRSAVKSPKPRVTAFMNRQEGPGRGGSLFSPGPTPKQPPGDTVEVLEMTGGPSGRRFRMEQAQSAGASPALSSNDRSTSLADHHMLNFDAQEGLLPGRPAATNQSLSRAPKRSIFMACMSAEAAP